MGHGEVREKLLYLGATHRLRMPFVMEQDELPDPLHIGVFRTETIVLGTDSHTHLLQEPERLIPWRRTVVLDHRVLLSDNAGKLSAYYTYVHYSKNASTCLGQSHWWYATRAEVWSVAVCPALRQTVICLRCPR